MGAIRKREGKGGYEGRWYDENGRQHSKTFPRKEDARAHVRSMEGAKVRGDSADPTRGRVPFREVAESWYAATAQAGLKPSTRNGYRLVLDSYLLPEFGDLGIGKVTRPKVRRFIAK